MFAEKASSVQSIFYHLSIFASALEMVIMIKQRPNDHQGVGRKHIQLPPCPCPLLKKCVQKVERGTTTRATTDESRRS